MPARLILEHLIVTIRSRSIAISANIQRQLAKQTTLQAQPSNTEVRRERMEEGTGREGNKHVQFKMVAVGAGRARGERAKGRMGKARGRGGNKIALSSMTADAGGNKVQEAVVQNRGRGREASSM